eukprot:jgi/Mesvir1/6458/Mv19537-RA.1
MVQEEVVTKAAKANAESPEPKNARERRFYLMKSEPESRLENGVEKKFSYNDLCALPNATSAWDGVRNYQARNVMKDMAVGDHAFFYHSNCKTPGIVGIVEVVKEAYPDHTAWDPKDPHYHPKSDPEKPTWFMVDVKAVRELKRFIPLEELKKHKSGPLATMALLTSSRLSVQPVKPAEWDFVLSLET